MPVDVGTVDIPVDTKVWWVDSVRGSTTYNGQCRERVIGKEVVKIKPLDMMVTDVEGSQYLMIGLPKFDKQKRTIYVYAMNKKDCESLLEIMEKMPVGETNKPEVDL